MSQLNQKVYLCAGYNTVSMGTGRKEFNPKKPRPGLEHYIVEAGQGALAQVADPAQVDEGVIANFMAARFNRQGNLAAMMPLIHPTLEYKPHVRVEGACGSGGLGLATALKTVLSGLAGVVLVVGVEVQNTVKAIYGADILAGAGHYAGDRKQGHAYYFPGKFSDRAGACYRQFGYDYIRKAMATWYKQAVENARRNPKAQEYHNVADDLMAAGMTPPNPKTFVEHINVFDCSKVSDGASAVIVASAEGLARLGLKPADAVEVAGYGTAVADITRDPEDLTRMNTTAQAVAKAYHMAEAGPGRIGVLELHDCFSIGALIALEAAGFADHGRGAALVLDGRTGREAELPTNATGGLIGFGHYTGGTGVRQAVDCLAQLTGRAGDSQVPLREERPLALMVSMGGNDRTVTAMIFKRAR